MPIELRMRPQDPPRTREQFLAEAPPYAIAVDGYVEGPPWRELELPDGPRININHHEGVPRLETRSSCMQALILVRLGLFDHFFRRDNEPHAEVFANDCDEDVCWTFFVLLYHWLVKPLLNPQVNRGVGLADIMDATAGMWPLPADVPLQRELAWIMFPYRTFRASGAIDRRNPEEFAAVVQDVVNRILQFITGKGKQIALDTRYTRIGGGPGWAMIREDGPYGRQGAFADGVRAFIAVRERSDGRWAYSVGRASDLDPFPVPRILTLATSLEKNGERWGGSSTIGGSDRARGSAVPPPVLEKAANELLAENA